MTYKGVIITESLENPEFVNNLKIYKKEILGEDSDDPWHLSYVEVDEKTINELIKELKQGWYAHFWKGRDIIAIFKGKKFKFNFDDKLTWKDAVEYGKSIGIPEEQLDFPIMV